MNIVYRVGFRYCQKVLIKSFYNFCIVMHHVFTILKFTIFVRHVIGSSSCLCFYCVPYGFIRNRRSFNPIIISQFFYLFITEDTFLYIFYNNLLLHRADILFPRVVQSFPYGVSCITFLGKQVKKNF